MWKTQYETKENSEMWNQVNIPGEIRQCDRAKPTP
jgi:hypothetical protein